MERRKNISKNLAALFVLTFLFLFLAPMQVSGQGGLVPCGGPDQPACQLCHFFELFDNIVKFVLQKLVPPIAVFMVVIGGVIFFAATGDPAKISKANSLFRNVALGLVIIYSAYLLVSLFFNIIGVNEWTGLQNWFEYPCP